MFKKKPGWLTLIVFMISITAISGSCLLIQGLSMHTPQAIAAEDGQSSGQHSGRLDPQQMKDHMQTVLSGLVSDGTITQDQADKVVEYFANSMPGQGQTPPTGQAPPTGQSSVREHNGFLNKLVTDGVLTQEQADAITAKIITRGPGGNDKTAHATKTNNVMVKVNDKLVTFDEQPFIDKSGRTQVPVRFIAEQLGGQVAWEESGKKDTVTIHMGDTTIDLKIGQNNASVNDKVYSLDTNATLKNGRTYVPVRFISEILGAKVNWDAASSTVQINTN